TVNAIILTQTRAAMLGLAAGAIAAPLLAPRGNRLRVCLYVVLGAVAAFSITNQAFWSRAETITASAEERDRSAASRFDLWKVGLEMWGDHPLGVGAGSFYTVAGEYDPQYAGRDCHNTYLRCAAELGVPGILLLLALIVNAFRTLRRAARLAAGTSVEQPIRWDCYAFQLALVAYLTAGIFMSVPYVEEFWWFLCLPVCLERSALGAREERVGVDPDPVPEGHLDAV